MEGIEKKMEPAKRGIWITIVKRTSSPSLTPPESYPQSVLKGGQSFTGFLPPLGCPPKRETHNDSESITSIPTT